MVDVSLNACRTPLSTRPATKTQISKHLKQTKSHAPEFSRVDAGQVQDFDPVKWAAIVDDSTVLMKVGHVYTQQFTAPRHSDSDVAELCLSASAEQCHMSIY